MLDVPHCTRSGQLLKPPMPTHTPISVKPRPGPSVGMVHVPVTAVKGPGSLNVPAGSPVTGSTPATQPHQLSEMSAATIFAGTSAMATW